MFWAFADGISDILNVTMVWSMPSTSTVDLKEYLFMIRRHCQDHPLDFRAKIILAALVLPLAMALVTSSGSVTFSIKALAGDSFDFDNIESGIEKLTDNQSYFMIGRLREPQKSVFRSPPDLLQPLDILTEYNITLFICKTDDSAVLPDKVNVLMQFFIAFENNVCYTF